MENTDEIIRLVAKEKKRKKRKYFIILNYY